MKLPFSFFMLISLCGSAEAGWFGPKNYDECILEHMQGVTHREAVVAIKNSCRAKFPEACYAWQKAHPKQPKEPGLFDDLDAKYDIKSKPTLANYARPYMPQEPEGCSEVLR